MKNEQTDLNKSIDALVDSLFAEDVVKSDNLDVASAAKTTADAAIAAAPALQDDAARGAGRPKAISDVPKTDEDGSRAGNYDASIAGNQSEEENEEAKKQAKSIDQTTGAGRLAEAPKMKDPRAGGQIMKKSVEMTDEEFAAFESFRKSQADAAEAAKTEEIKKSEDLRKAELENLVKSAVASAVAPLQAENAELKKSLTESTTLVKAMAAQPQRAKSVTGVQALEKSERPEQRQTEFSKQEKLDAAERLVMKKSLPMDAVIELENTGTVYRKDWQQAIAAELEKTN